MRLFTVIAALFFSGSICAAPIHNFVVFGDSLSDNGNLYELMHHQLPQSPPYFQGRFSNGPVWIELLADHYFHEPIIGLLDYAIGGAGVSEDPDAGELLTLTKELNNYFDENQDTARADSLYIVWIGANNYLGVPEDADTALHDVNVGITHGLETLVEKGAKHILVINLPDLGHSPAAVEFNAVEAYSYFSKQHNLLLDASFAQLKQEYPQVDWLFFDMQSVFQDAVEHPANYGFTNITDSCYNSTSNGQSNPVSLQIAAEIKAKPYADACDGFMFFDLVHPTMIAHKILADKVQVMLDAADLEIGD
ncbi:MAG: SGNH/GDSL hydrolase family protein [Legionella sp.]|jgi:phospholipase/lecithinase/hemolysin